MIIVPMTTTTGGRGPHVLLLILEKENLCRMQEADPFDLHLSQYGAYMDIDRPMRELDIVIAYEDDMEKARQFIKASDITGLVEYLQRGRKLVAADLHEPLSLTKGSGERVN